MLPALYYAHAAFRVFVAVSFIVIGVLHFTHGALFEAIMPPYLPAPMFLVYLSGVFEIAGGVGLLIPRLRWQAGIGLLLLLVAVFPANWHMYANNVYLPVEWLDQNPDSLYWRLWFQPVIAIQVIIAMQSPTMRRPPVMDRDDDDLSHDLLP